VVHVGNSDVSCSNVDFLSVEPSMIPRAFIGFTSVAGAFTSAMLFQYVSLNVSALRLKRGMHEVSAGRPSRRSVHVCCAVSRDSFFCRLERGPSALQV